MSVAILAFHAVEDGPAPLCFPPARFRALVDALAASGASALTVADAAAGLRAERPLPARAVVFTFDDGYASVARTALPVLRAAGFPATVFVVAGALGTTNTWDPPGVGGGGLDLLAEDAVGDLVAAGWEVGSHTDAHRALPDLADEEIAADLDRADARIAALTGARPASFAYPYGRHDARTRRSVAGRYTAAVVTGAALARVGDPADALPRVEAWYLRRPVIATHLHDPLGAAYLGARRALRGVRARVGRSGRS